MFFIKNGVKIIIEVRIPLTLCFDWGDSMKNEIVEKLYPVIQGIVEGQQLHLYELDFVKEDGIWFLRVSIEKEDGTMDFETAEIISNLVSKKLDELDPIDHEYILDVCSPGAERPIKGKEDFPNYLNQYISVYLNEPIDKKDTLTGDLIEVNEEGITIAYKDKTRVKKATIEFSNITKAHLAIKF